MKKILSMLLVASFILCTACQTDNKKTKKKQNRDSETEYETEETMETESINESGIIIYNEDDMTELASEMINSLHEMANDDSYISLFLNGASVDQTVIDQLANAEIDENEVVYVINLTSDSIEDYIEIESGHDVSLTDYEKQIIGARLDSMLVNQSNGVNSMNFIVINSILQMSRNYVAQDIDSQMWVIPTNDSEIAIYASFTPSGDNVVTIRTGYIYLSDGMDGYIDNVSLIFDVETTTINW